MFFLKHHQFMLIWLMCRGFSQTSINDACRILKKIAWRSTNQCARVSEHVYATPRPALTSYPRMCKSAASMMCASAGGRYYLAPTPATPPHHLYFRIKHACKHESTWFFPHLHQPTHNIYEICENNANKSQNAHFDPCLVDVAKNKQAIAIAKKERIQDGLLKQQQSRILNLYSNDL